MHCIAERAAAFGPAQSVLWLMLWAARYANSIAPHAAQRSCLRGADGAEFTLRAYPISTRGIAQDLRAGPLSLISSMCWQRS